MPRGGKELKIVYNTKNYDPTTDRSTLVFGIKAGWPGEELVRIADKLLRLGGMTKEQLVELGFVIKDGESD